MRKIGFLVKEKIIDEIKTKATNSKICVFVGFNKVPAYTLNVLRNNLKKANANFFVARNTLIKKAFADLGKDSIDDFLKAETGIVFADENSLVETCKILINFSKENEALALRGAIFENKKLLAKEIEDLSKLPSRQVLLGMAVSSLASPLIGFVTTLNTIISSFLYILEQIKNIKEGKNN